MVLFALFCVQEEVGWLMIKSSYEVTSDSSGIEDTLADRDIFSYRQVRAVLNIRMPALQQSPTDNITRPTTTILYTSKESCCCF